jgi:hypothetical protein
MSLSDIIQSEIAMVSDYKSQERYKFNLYNLMHELDCSNFRDGIRFIINKLFQYMDRFHNQLKQTRFEHQELILERDMNKYGSKPSTRKSILERCMKTMSKDDAKNLRIYI